MYASPDARNRAFTATIGPQRDDQKPKIARGEGDNATLYGGNRMARLGQDLSKDKET